MHQYMLLLLCSMVLANQVVHGYESIPQARTVIVFSPHPDDDILGCGGTLVKHVKENARVIIVYFTSGEKAFTPPTPEELARIREEEAKEAAHFLGVHELVFLREPDGNLTNSTALVDKVAALISDLEPDIIYVTHKVELHPDHMAANSIVVDAVGTLKKSFHPLVLGYEVWTPLETITHISDISTEITQKLNALAKHNSQVTFFNYLDAVKSLDRYRGIMQAYEIGKVEYAECFKKIDIPL